jgi:pyrroloquinoline quinone (PQQ) biosynthesis protein C
MEKVQSSSAKCYEKKIKTNPEFYANEKKRVAEYMKNRYMNDEEYRNKILEQKRQSYYRRKTLKQSSPLSDVVVNLI